MVVNATDTILAALAEPTRRRVVELLSERPRRATELAIAVGASGPAMSRHLRVLRASGLVKERRIDRDARVHLYCLRREPLVRLRTWLDEAQTFWSDQSTGGRTASAARD